MKTTIIQAIYQRQRLQVIYKNTTRIIEPYLLYETKAGIGMLHGWQTGGEYGETPPPKWCNLKLSDIADVTPIGEHYDQPHPEYNPDSTNFHRVLAFTPPGPMTRSASF